MNLNLMAQEDYEKFMGSFKDKNLNRMEEGEFQEYLSRYSPLGLINILHKMAYLVDVNGAESYSELSNIHLLVSKLDKHLSTMARNQINKENQ